MNDPTDPGAQPSGAVTYVSPEIYFSPDEQDLVDSDDAPASPDPGPAQTPVPEAPVPPAVPPVDAPPDAAPPAEESPTPESPADEPPIVRHDPFAYMRGAPWMDRRLSPSGRAAYLLRRELEAFPVIEGRDPNHADLDDIVKRTVDCIAPILKREQATDAAYDELERQRAARISEVQARAFLGSVDANRNSPSLMGVNWQPTPSEGPHQADRRSPTQVTPAMPFAGGRQVMEGSPLWTRLRASYSAQNPRYHQYEFTERLCETSNPRCTADAAFDALRRYAVPGRPTNGQPVENGEVSLANVMGLGGHVQTWLEPSSRSIVNVTQPDHFLHAGMVLRQIVREGDSIYVRTIGIGINDSEWKKHFNEQFGSLAFVEATFGAKSQLDLEPPAAIASPHLMGQQK